VIRVLLASTIALVSSSAFAIEINGVELNAQVSPMQLKERLNVEVIPAPGSPAALRACMGLMGNGRKYKECINRVPNNVVPIPAGDYNGQAKIWESDVDCQVKIDNDGHVQAIIVSFPSSSFAKIEGGAINKWGKPDNTGETLFMEKANGASGTSTDDEWTLPDGSTISLSSRHDGLHGQLMLRMH
jgi:hypothetical protein